MKLPNYEQAVVPEAKIVRYLLNLASENGQSKARFFLAFGFKIETWEHMAEALKNHAKDCPVTKVLDNPPFGVNYVVEGQLQTPDGRNPKVRVIWAIDQNDTIPHLISAYPL